MIRLGKRILDWLRGAPKPSAKGPGRVVTKSDESPPDPIQ